MRHAKLRLLFGRYSRPGSPILGASLALMIVGWAASQAEEKAPGISIDPNPEGGSPRIRADRSVFDPRGNAIVTLPVGYNNGPRIPCVTGMGLFYVTPGGFGLLFRQRRAELPFTAKELPSPETRSVSLVFATQSCQVTIKVEKSVREGSDWLPLAPAAEN